MSAERVVEGQGQFETLLQEGLIAKAYHYAEKMHDGQLRRSGEPYITHPLEVARIISEEWGIKEEAVLAAAFLHDIPEDVDRIEISDIERDFGPEIASLVHGVTKFKGENGEEDDQKTLEKIVDLSFIDPRVAILKLADRLHNMRTLGAVKRESQLAKAEETLKVYAPLAESLGMWHVKIELEDRALSYQDPRQFALLRNKIDNDPRTTEFFQEHWRGILSDLFEEAKVPVDIQIRRVGIFELKEKFKKANLSLESDVGFLNTNDVVSLRLIVTSPEDLHRANGLIHEDETLSPMIDFDRFDFFIGDNRRINGYSAIQTTLDTPFGAVEIALATRQMEEFNNWGVVSLIQSGVENLDEYTLKLVFTPKGEVVFLPRSANGLDFAYAIDPLLGASAKELLVNGQRMPLTTRIRNGSEVKVVIDDTQTIPPVEHLYYASPRTQRIIKEMQVQAAAEENIERGKELIRPVLMQRAMMELEDAALSGDKIVFGGKRVVPEYIYSRVGSGQMTLETLAKWLDEEIIPNKGDEAWLYLEGKDQKGILATISGLIKEFGGNIIGMNAPQISEGGSFRLRFRIKGGSPQNLVERLQGDSSFSFSKLI